MHGDRQIAQGDAAGRVVGRLHADKDLSRVGFVDLVSRGVGEAINAVLTGLGRVANLPIFNDRRAIGRRADGSQRHAAAHLVVVVGENVDQHGSVFGGLGVIVQEGRATAHQLHGVIFHLAIGRIALGGKIGFTAQPEARRHRLTERDRCARNIQRHLVAASANGQGGDGLVVIIGKVAVAGKVDPGVEDAIRRRVDGDFVLRADG